LAASIDTIISLAPIAFCPSIYQSLAFHI